MDVTTTENMALTAQQKVRRKKMGILLLASGMMIAIGVFAPGRHNNLISENAVEAYAGRCAFLEAYIGICPPSAGYNPPPNAPVGSYYATCKQQVVDDAIEITESDCGTSAISAKFEIKCPIAKIYKRMPGAPFWVEVSEITPEVRANTPNNCETYYNGVVNPSGEVCPKWKE